MCRFLVPVPIRRLHNKCRVTLPTYKAFGVRFSIILQRVHNEQVYFPVFIGLFRNSLVQRCGRHPVDSTRLNLNLSTVYTVPFTLDARVYSSSQITYQCPRYAPKQTEYRHSNWSKREMRVKERTRESTAKPSRAAL